jgi:tripartite ATP-independent transporter DctM subunit
VSAHQAPRGPAAWADALLGRPVESLAAILVLLEVLVLLAGIVARALGHPLVWSDELASMLFLWLAMLGAVVALRRDEHMRMNALVARLGPAWRERLHALALGASLALLGFIAWPAWQFAQGQQIITTPAMGLSDLWRAAAMPLGIVLMAAVALLRLLRECTPRRALGALLLPVLVGLLLAWARPQFESLGQLDLLIFLVGVGAGCVLAGIPIAFAFGLAAFSYLAMSTQTPLQILVGRMDEGMSHLILLAVPLFVFLGLLIEMTGMARAMIDFLAALLGHVGGGLSYVLVGAMYLVSGISGSKAADMAAIAPALFPEMQRQGSSGGELVALLAATGAQTETVPPSLVLITIGSVTGVSISALFTGGLLPALVTGVALCLLIWRRNRGQGAHRPRAPRSEVLRLGLIAAPALALPFVIRAAVVDGIATATEVSTLGIVYATAIGLLVYRRFDWRRLLPMLVETASLSGSILFIIGTATAIAWGLTQSGFSGSLAQAMASLPGGGPVFLAASIPLFVLLGSVLEGIPAMVLFGPLLFPVAQQLGINEVHYAMVVVLSMGLGLFMPPLGVGYYAACAIGRVPPEQGVRPLLGYLAALLAGIIVVAAVPWLSTGFLAR